MNRYQSGPGQPGVMPTAEWFSALLRGVDGPLGSVTDIGCAEGEMLRLAEGAGATSVLGIGRHPDGMASARKLASERITVREGDVREYAESSDTIVYSMMAHWLGREETARIARLARKWFLVVFRGANEHYAIPENGTWFPTLAEMDETVGGIRTREQVVLEQDRGKLAWAVTYRMDMSVRDGIVRKRGWPEPLRHGRDLHGDQPFRPTHGAPLADLTPDERAKVRALAREIVQDAFDVGRYPLDFSPRNVIVGAEGAFLVDRVEMAPVGDGHVPLEYLAVWQRTLSTVGIDFDGDLVTLL